MNSRLTIKKKHTHALSLKNTHLYTDIYKRKICTRSLLIHKGNLVSMFKNSSIIFAQKNFFSRCTRK